MSKYMTTKRVVTIIEKSPDAKRIEEIINAGEISDADVAAKQQGLYDDLKAVMPNLRKILEADKAKKAELEGKPAVRGHKTKKEQNYDNKEEEEQEQGVEDYHKKIEEIEKRVKERETEEGKVEGKENKKKKPYESKRVNDEYDEDRYEDQF